MPVYEDHTETITLENGNDTDFSNWGGETNHGATVTSVSGKLEVEFDPSSMYYDTGFSGYFQDGFSVVTSDHTPDVEKLNYGFRPGDWMEFYLDHTDITYELGSYQAAFVQTGDSYGSGFDIPLGVQIVATPRFGHEDGPFVQLFRGAGALAEYADPSKLYYRLEFVAIPDVDGQTVTLKHSSDGSSWVDFIVDDFGLSSFIPFEPALFGFGFGRTNESGDYDTYPVPLSQGTWVFGDYTAQVSYQLDVTPPYEPPAGWDYYTPNLSGNIGNNSTRFWQ